jgi:hypothetical protein
MNFQKELERNQELLKQLKELEEKIVKAQILTQVK